MHIPYIDQLTIANKKLMLRLDLNVPLASGKVTSDARIKAALPTIRYALQQNAGILIVSHLGRPKEGQFDPNVSLRPVAERLSQLLEQPVRFENDWIDGLELTPGEVVVGENVRFLAGEKANDPELAKKMASLVDVFVMDAFATAHRASASTSGVTHWVDKACGGLLLKSELKALENIWHDPARPVLAIMGGAKVSGKIGVLKALMQRADYIIPGGGIANTLLAAKGYDVADSLYEGDMLTEAKQLLQYADDHNVKLELPKDVVVADQLNENAQTKVYACDQIEKGMIVDIGPTTRQHYQQLVHRAQTILWNGPVGVFEYSAFYQGTQDLAQAIAQSKAYTVAGGGDTVAAIEQFGVVEQMSYISTGGGAFLELLEHGTLPAIEALQKKGA